MENAQTAVQIIRPLLFCLLLLLTFAGANPGAPTMVPFSSEKLGFSVAYPDSFEVLPPPSPSVGLLLKPKSDGFPTFNILAIPGANEPSNGQGEDQSLVDNYRGVGILDAAVISSSKTAISGIEAYAAQVTYHNGGEAFISSVAIVPGIGRHYVLTFIDTAESFEKHRNLRDQLWAAFQANHVATDSTDTSESGLIYGWSAFLVLILIVGARVAVVKLQRKNVRGRA
jgi:hypothetical protein